jgi:predicted enzyme related to lactoylglutathione lyase
MPNPAGSPIWYELMTPDPDGAKLFYDKVAGWTIEAAPSRPLDYRMISATGGLAGGVLRVMEMMLAEGAQPAWLFYVSVEDADAAVARVQSLGGRILVPPTDIEGVGRFALLTDPQGAPFYIMRASGEETSNVFAPGESGRCGWDELWTKDVTGALAFYGALFGWENRETMDMGPLGGYHFLDHGAVRLGAAVRMPDRPVRWNFYFTVPDLDAAITHVRTGGGTIDIGPHDVPSGERIIHGTDPQKVAFALVSRGKAGR